MSELLIEQKEEIISTYESLLNESKIKNLNEIEKRYVIYLTGILIRL